MPDSVKIYKLLPTTMPTMYEKWPSFQVVVACCSIRSVIGLGIIDECLDSMSFIHPFYYEN